MLTKEALLAQLQDMVEDLGKPASNEQSGDGYLCRYFVNQCPITGQWEVQLFTDDGFGNGNHIGTLDIAAPERIGDKLADPFAPVREAFKEYSSNHPELEIAIWD